MVLPGGWIADLFGYKDIYSGATLMPRRKAFRLLGANVSDNALLGTTDIQTYGGLAANQANWFVSATGNDVTGDGTAGAPFATIDKLSQVMCPGFTQLRMTQNMVVTLGAGNLGSGRLNIDPNGFKFQIFGNVTSSAAITLSGVVNTNPAANTRGELTTASGVFVSKKRIRSTSGAQSGAITRSTGLHTGATNTYVAPWMLPLTFAVVNVANGTTCVVDTLNTTIAALSVYTPDNVVSGGSIEVRDVLLPNGIRCDSGLVNFIGCEISQVMWATHCAYYNCAFPGQIQCIHGTFFFFGCGIYDLSQAEQFSAARFGAGCFSDGGRWLATLSGRLDFTQPFEFENGVAGNAIELFSGGSIGAASGKLWGASANYTIGLLVGAGCTFWNNTTMQVAIPATTQLSLAGKASTYAAVTTSLYTRAGACIALDPDAGASILSA